jgi:hypothetical protein
MDEIFSLLIELFCALLDVFSDMARQDSSVRPEAPPAEFSGLSTYQQPTQQDPRTQGR